MQTPPSLPLILIALAILSGCAMPTNPSLTEAHTSYNNARANPDVTNLAALELKQASDSLNKADNALSKGESTTTVNQLAYLAKQQVDIAQETAKRKTAELGVTQASAKRDQMRLEARTAEADAARQQAAIMQSTAEQQAAELAAAKTQAERGQMQLEARTAEADAAKQQAMIAQGTAEQQAAELAAANAKAESAQTLIAQQEMQLKELNAKQTERGLVITLGDVLFNPGQAQLKSGSMRSIHKLVDFLKQYPQRKVLIEGYTDSTGSDRLNQKLSERRARAVRTALTDSGIDEDRITTRGYGKAFPVTDNDTPANRQMNRRVEITLSDDNGKIPDARER